MARCTDQLPHLHRLSWCAMGSDQFPLASRCPGDWQGYHQIPLHLLACISDGSGFAATEAVPYARVLDNESREDVEVAWQCCESLPGGRSLRHRHYAILHGS